MTPDFLTLVKQAPEYEPIDTWAAPEKIEVQSIKAAALTEQDVPVYLRDYVFSEAAQMETLPEFLFVDLLTAIGSLIGGDCAVKPKKNSDWCAYALSWGMKVGAPGSNKSAPYSAVKGLLAPLQARADEAYSKQLAPYLADKNEYDAKKKAIEKAREAAANALISGDKEQANRPTMESLKQQELELKVPVPPAKKSYGYDAATYQKVHELCVDNPRGLYLNKDELSSLFTYLNDPKNDDARTFYLEAANGNQPYVMHTIGRGSTNAERCNVVIGGGMQPDKLAPVIRAAINGGNDGLLLRFRNIVWPDVTITEPTDLAPNLKARESIKAILSEIDQLNYLQAGAQVVSGCCVPAFAFDSQAQAMFDAWRQDLKLSQLAASEAGNGLYAEYLAKCKSYVPTLALINHILEIASGGEFRKESYPTIGADSVTQAITTAKFFRSHAEKILALGSKSATDIEVSLAKRILNGDLKDGFTVRDISRKCWSGLKEDRDIQSACEYLSSLNWLRREERSGTGRPTQKYSINPSLNKSCLQ